MKYRSGNSLVFTHQNEKTRRIKYVKKTSHNLNILKDRREVPVVTGDDDVDSSAGLADVFGLLVVHLPQGVCERARGVDHTLGLHVKFMSCEEKIYMVLKRQKITQQTLFFNGV